MLKTGFGTYGMINQVLIIQIFASLLHTIHFGGEELLIVDCLLEIKGHIKGGGVGPDRTHNTVALFGLFDCCMESAPVF